jgi:CRP/FNR family transcriptional regulator
MLELTTAYLRAHFPLLRDDGLRKDIAKHGTLHQFTEGVMVLKEEQYLDHIPLVSKGGVKVIRHTRGHQNIFLYFIRPGEVCTMTLSSCLKRQTSQVHACTVTPTEMILLPMERVYYYTKHFPSWNEFTLENFSEKFDNIMHAFDWLAFEPLKARIMHYLEDTAQLCGQSSLTITHVELATDMGASRVSVSRVLKELEQEGSLKLERKMITIGE